MSTNALLLELLLSGFFATACFKARAVDVGTAALTPRNIFRLKGRLERLSVTRWQWFSMVLVVVLVRLQNGLPLMVELTVAAQLVIFLALPVGDTTFETARPMPGKRTTPLLSRYVHRGRA